MMGQLFSRAPEAARAGWRRMAFLARCIPSYPSPAVPEGYVPLALATKLMLASAGDWGVPLGWAHLDLLRKLSDLIGDAAARGAIRLVAMHADSGTLTWIPEQTWRMSLNFGNAVWSPAYAACKGKLLRLPTPAVTVCNVLTSKHDLAVVAGAICPPPLPRESILNAIQEHPAFTNRGEDPDVGGGGASDRFKASGVKAGLRRDCKGNNASPPEPESTVAANSVVKPNAAAADLSSATADPCSLGTSDGDASDHDVAAAAAPATDRASESSREAAPSSSKPDEVVEQRRSGRPSSNVLVLMEFDRMFGNGECPRTLAALFLQLSRWLAHVHANEIPMSPKAVETCLRHKRGGDLKRIPLALPRQ